MSAKGRSLQSVERNRLEGLLESTLQDNLRLRRQLQVSQRKGWWQRYRQLMQWMQQPRKRYSPKPVVPGFGFDVGVVCMLVISGLAAFVV